MSITTFYIVRHGQSYGNLEDLFLGHTDMDLTDLGYEQAAITADFLDPIHFDAIYSSDLSRAYHTAEVTAKRKGLSVRKDPALREIYAGIWEAEKFNELGDKWYNEFQLWGHDFGNCYCPGGESVPQLRERITTALERIAKAHPGETIGIFSHAVVIRVLTAAWLGLTAAQMQDHPWPSNASVTKAIYRDEKFTLVAYNEDDFMGEKRTTLD